MSLRDVTLDAVLGALAEYDQLGRRAFLARYGFGESVNYALIHEGRTYDSKAVVAVAHGLARPDLGALTASDFSGGQATVVSCLHRLGLKVLFSSGPTSINGAGHAVGATFELEGWGSEWSVTLHSRGGTIGTPTQRNPGYANGLRLLLARLGTVRAVITSIEVSSERTRELPAADRLLQLTFPIQLHPDLDAEQLRLRISTAQTAVGRGGAPGGNPTRRIRISVQTPRPRTGLDLCRLLSRGDEARTALLRDKGHWLFTVNPSRYRVLDELREAGALSPTWRLGQHWDRVRVGDDVALWLSGSDGGVLAIGVVIGPPVPETEPDNPYWTSMGDAAQTAWRCRIAFSRIVPPEAAKRAALLADARFATAGVLVPGRRRSPLALSADQWAAIADWIDALDEQERLIVSSRAKEVTPPDLTAGTPPRSYYDLPSRRVAMEFAERRLVEDYQHWLGRRVPMLPLEAPEASLVADAFDEQRWLLLEAKADSGREFVRMALGQLLDYQQFAPALTQLAALLPRRPAASLVDLLRRHDVGVIYREGDGFIEML